MYSDLDSPSGNPAAASRADTCVARDSKRKPRLQILAPIYGDRNYFALTGLGIDMVATIDAPE